MVKFFTLSLVKQDKRWSIYPGVKVTRSHMFVSPPYPEWKVYKNLNTLTLVIYPYPEWKVHENPNTPPLGTVKTYP